MAENFTNLSNVVVQGFVKSSGQGTLLGSFETMPTASAQNAGQIVLYTGTTAGSYTKGRYYKSDGTSWTEYDAGQVTASTLEGYVPKDGSKVLSDNNYTTPEKNKLAGIATGAQVNKIDVVKVNGTALTPDASKAVNVTIDLSGYATKDEVSKIPKFAVQVVASLPTSNISSSTIYLVSHGGTSPEIYDEYIYVNSAWEKIGTTETDLSNYVTNDALTSKLNGYQPTISAGTGISKSGNTVSLATSGVTAGSKGSATAVPIVTVDEYGRVTALGTATIYPPTTAGTSGQIWTSDGSGAGAWISPATTATSGSTTPITSGAVYSKLAEKQDKLSSAGSSTTPVYVNSSGVPTACSYSLGAAASKGVDTSVNSGSSNLVTGGAVYSAINGLVPKSGATMTGQLVAQGNTAYTTGQVRNIYLSTEEPTDDVGVNGDIWFVYSV